MPKKPDWEIKDFSGGLNDKVDDNLIADAVDLYALTSRDLADHLLDNPVQEVRADLSTVGDGPHFTIGLIWSHVLLRQHSRRGPHFVEVRSSVPIY